MAALGGMLAAAILKVVGDQIGAAIGGQIKLQKDFDKDLRKMKMALESVEAVLEAAEGRSITDKPTILWLKRLTDAMYDISSIIDEFEANMEATTQSSAQKIPLKKRLLQFGSCLPVRPKITMANQMKVMRDELKEITDNHQSFTLLSGTNAIQLSFTDIRETSSTMGHKENIVGRTDEKNKILGCLSESIAKEFIVLPIYGIGGLGKTTLAKIVFNHSQFRAYSQVWIYVSQTFDLKKIGNSIISQLSKEESHYTDIQMIHNSLRELLANKKILIVLDDLWEDNKSHLDEMMDMLKIGESASVAVIVTTRSEDIATKISTVQPHKLASLTDEMCWTIMKQKSAFELRDDQEELEHVGKDIARKCGGVALAAQSLGHMLHFLTFDEWESIRNSDIWNVPDSEDSSFTCVLASLRLSYSVMPPSLKLCFAYCAIFPKGYKIVKNDLIQQWISLGFIKATNMLSTWQLGEKYMRQLVGLSFLEHSKSALTTGVDFETDTLFTMHDLVHDLARSVMVDEILVASKQGNTGGSCCHFALLNDCGKPLESPKIRALRFMKCDEIKLHGVAFSSAKSMRVLDLSECSIRKLPNSIGVLKQLRYLKAPRIQHVTIPDSITRLSKLIYLDLHGSPALLEVPKSIGDIEGLVYLNLSGCSGIKKLPESFGRLKDLVHLDFSKCYVQGISAFLGSFTQLQYLNLSYCQNIGKLPHALGGLSKLQYLNLSFSSYVKWCNEADVLGALTKLEYLNLSSVCSDLRKLPDALGRFSQLKYLNLSGCRNITELPRLSSRLQYLNLARSTIFSLPEGLTKLSYLNISQLGPIPEDPLDRLVNHVCSNFSDLEHLDLSLNWCLNKIPESICSLRKLHTLDLSGCGSLKKIPEIVGRIDSLKFLYLKGCQCISESLQLGSSALALPYFQVQLGYGDSGSNLVRLQHTDPIELHISKLENVKSVREAHCIQLMGKQKLEELELEWTRDVERFVDDKLLLENLVPPCTLKKLEICGYSGVSFPAWLVGQLPNLKELVLRGMASLEEWDTSYSSGEEHMIQTLEIRDCPMLRMRPPLPRASIWKISNSDSVLSSWEERTVSHTNSPITTIELSVENCQVPLHQWRFLRYFSGLTYLCIDNCGDLTSSAEINQRLSSMESLCLEDTEFEKLPKWMGELISLQNLEIRECRGAQLSEHMRQLTKLKNLRLFNCNNMASLPHWLGELTSLTEFSIWHCHVLRSFPESIQQLTGLERLTITGCHELKHLIESTEGNMKLMHNQERTCALPTSLKELGIWGCKGIRSLPTGIQQLTNLKRICVFSCPEFKHIVESEEGMMTLAHNQDRACVLPISLEELVISDCQSIKSLPEGIQQLTNLQRLEICECPELKKWCELEENKMKLAHIQNKHITIAKQTNYCATTNLKIDTVN